MNKTQENNIPYVEVGISTIDIECINNEVYHKNFIAKVFPGAIYSSINERRLLRDGCGIKETIKVPIHYEDIKTLTKSYINDSIRENIFEITETLFIPYHFIKMINIVYGKKTVKMESEPHYTNGYYHHVEKLIFQE